MTFEHAKLVDVSSAKIPPPSVQVLFNPTDYGISHGANYAAMTVPGLESPIQQFVRGEASVLSLELFLDQTNLGLDVQEALDQLHAFVTIDPVLHHPPVCKFVWGKTEFTGIVTSMRDRYGLFSPDGRILRARVAITMKEYKSAEVQRRELKRSSPDRTHRRILQAGQTLSDLAAEVYGDPGLWRPIAEANDIDQPRFVPPGTPLVIPAL
ncbi:MAG: LysM peptidoglycan-binding domain-containing protein [Myxococcales bacterium]|nr:LysM peptidoglycan-binding domain-containing protein [Myxococcales bacterium]